ncbi:MAG: sensor histidine kinase [Thermodesulfobacteriota bacterium]
MNDKPHWWQRVKNRIKNRREEKRLPKRYRKLQRNIIILMLVVTIIPLTLMAVLNAMQYQKNITTERIDPMRSIANKATHSFELFLEERLSAIKFIASSHSFQSLSDQKNLHRIYRILREKYGGYVDLGLINAEGKQVSYAGPYDLLNKDYSNQDWFKEVQVKGIFVSDVFMGYREFPHIALAVQHMTDSGDTWILRATMDTQKFANLINAMSMSPVSDAFLINNKDTLQTDSRFYGEVLNPLPIEIPNRDPGTHIMKDTDPLGRKIFVIYSTLIKHDLTLVMAIPRSFILKTWHTLMREMSYMLIASILLIVFATFSSTHRLVTRIREADEKREAAFRELEYNQKLSSIGRLAAGVAHEINNPLSIINEKAGLLKDLVENDMHHDKDKLMRQVNPILHSISRSRSITHRLLGFARRIEIQYEKLDLNEVLLETMGFLEKEAHHRDITVEQNLAEDLPRISSDRGQLQQVLLNIITNAFAAVSDGGKVSLTTWEADGEQVGIAISDNGHGMSQETLRQIFEPFFTTKKTYGTGLGLSITYGIVKKLGGDIKVNSTVGVGSTFTVFLPKKAPGGQNEQY